MKCQQKTEVYARVCGFFRPVQQWNLGKKEEYRERVAFVVPTVSAEADFDPTGNG
jgi:ribonucleoside-triphosphate reductase